MIKEVKAGNYIDTHCTGFDEARAIIDSLETKERTCNSCSKIKHCYHILHINRWTERGKYGPTTEYDEYESWFCEDCIKERFSVRE